MSDVFDTYMERLSKAISNPSPLAIAFQSRNIIDRDEQTAITDKSDTRTTQDRTISLLNILSRRLSVDPEKMDTVVRVLYNHQPTKEIAIEMARDG